MVEDPNANTVVVDDDFESEKYELDNGFRVVCSDTKAEETSTARMSSKMVGNVYTPRLDGNPHLSLHMVFNNLVAYKKVLLDYSIQ